jgi:hypothetical protein
MKGMTQSHRLAALRAKKSFRTPMTMRQDDEGDPEEFLKVQVHP